MTSSAEKLLESLKASPFGRTREEVIRMLVGFGFTVEHGAKHWKVYHPTYHQIHTTFIPNQSKIKPFYVRQSIGCVMHLKTLLEIQDDHDV